MERISVIIPMYNSEAFIKQCIESVLSQTYPYFEIIVIDDGSLDRGAEICRKLKKKDDRIRLLGQENRGVSSARNRGIELATGKYVFFLDSDDVIHPYLFEEFIETAEKYQTEITVCGIQKVNDRQITRKMNKVFDGKNRCIWEISKGGKESEEWFHKKYFDNLTVIGGKMVRRDCIGAVRFDESQVNGEDTLFIYDLICKNVRIAWLEQKWYYYRMHSGNASRSYRIIGGKQYYEVSRRIRDREYRRGHIQYALHWEKILICQMTRNYSILKKERSKEECYNLKKNAFSERKKALFYHLDISVKILFYCCFYCYLFYPFIKRLISALWLISDMFIWFSKESDSAR